MNFRCIKSALCLMGIMASTASGMNNYSEQASTFITSYNSNRLSNKDVTTSIKGALPPTTRCNHEMRLAVIDNELTILKEIQQHENREMVTGLYKYLYIKLEEFYEYNSSMADQKMFQFIQRCPEFNEINAKMQNTWRDACIDCTHFAIFYMILFGITFYFIHSADENHH